MTGFYSLKWYTSDGKTGYLVVPHIMTSSIINKNMNKMPNGHLTNIGQHRIKELNDASRMNYDAREWCFISATPTQVTDNSIIFSSFSGYVKMALVSWIHRWPVAHCIDVIMTTMASQITSLTVVYSTVYSDADQRKHQSSASLAFVLGIHRDRWIPRPKGQLRGKCFHLMTSSCSTRKGRVMRRAVPCHDVFMS